MTHPISSSAPDHQGNEPAFDREDLLRRVGGSTAILSEIAEVFCADAVRMRSDLNENIRQRAQRQAAATAHQLKGALLNLSARTAAATARELELALKAASWSAADELAARLSRELDSLVLALSREFATA
ncbi:MAG: Hpt domain-containing protein [Polyangiaceae bacterium]